MTKLRTYDPSRTGLIRRQFYADIKRRMQSVSQAIKKLFLVDNVLGEAKQVPFVLTTAVQNAWVEMQANTIRNAVDIVELELEEHYAEEMEKQKSYEQQNVTVWNFDPTTFQFTTTPQKLRMFQQWLKEQVDAGLLAVDGGIKGRPWTAKWVESAYRKGMLRAYMDVHKRDKRVKLPFYGGAKSQFLKDAFLQPVPMDSLELLFTRSFEALRGISMDMSIKMGRILADGFVNGYGPKKIARLMTKEISGLTRSRAMLISRTEIIRAHAIGQLDGFQLMGIEVVGVEPEVQISTAGDALVCEKCRGLEGKKFKVKDQRTRSLLPVHPRCRCSFRYVISEKILKKAGVKST